MEKFNIFHEYVLFGNLTFYFSITILFTFFVSVYHCKRKSLTDIFLQKKNSMMILEYIQDHLTQKPVSNLT